MSQCGSDSVSKCVRVIVCHLCLCVAVYKPVRDLCECVYDHKCKWPSASVRVNSHECEGPCVCVISYMCKCVCERPVCVCGCVCERFV